MKLGRIAAREHIPEDVARAKAPGGNEKRVWLRASSLSCPEEKNGCRVKQREQNEGHQAALILGPRCAPPQRRVQGGAQIWPPFFSEVAHVCVVRGYRPVDLEQLLARHHRAWHVPRPHKL